MGVKKSKEIKDAFKVVYKGDTILAAVLKVMMDTGRIKNLIKIY